MNHVHSDLIENVPSPLTVWLCDPTYTQQAISCDLIPQAVGGIATFTETRVDLANLIRVFKYPEKLAQALSEDGIPDVIGFSNYIWNASLSYAIAERIKEVAPDTITIFGGPNFPIVDAEAEAYLRARPAIDFYVVKEGELAFSRLIEKLTEPGMCADSIHGTIPSVHSIDKENVYHNPDTIERLRDLAVIPSPYSTGRMDEFFDGKLAPIIQTNRGCPFSCTFCTDGMSYYNKIYKNSAEKIAGEIEYIGSMMAESCAKGGRNDLFIADSNFGMYKEDISTCEQIANTQRKYDWPEYINVATGKNQKKRVLEAARLINGALRLSGSIQSLDTEVLENIKRSNIAPEELMSVALEAADVGANSYCETILALPGDSREKHMKTLELAISAGFIQVSTFQLMLLPGSEMCTEETRKKFAMDTRFRVFPRCFGYYDILGQRIVAAEIEEVCVGSSTLPFEEYLQCRVTHLMIAIFHNDGIFGTILKFIRQNDLSVFRWLELLSNNTTVVNFEKLKARFMEMTEQELWDDERALHSFIREDGNIDRYIDGDIGFNLLFTFKSRAITECAEELSVLVRDCTLELLRETGQISDIDQAFVEQAVQYHNCRMSNLFHNHDRQPEANLHFDFKAFEEAIELQPMAEYRFDTPRSFKFVLLKEQRELVARYLDIFGDTKYGIGRMITKIHLERLLRKPEWVV